MLRYLLWLYPFLKHNITYVTHSQDDDAVKQKRNGEASPPLHRSGDPSFHISKSVKQSTSKAPRSENLPCGFTPDGYFVTNNGGASSAQHLSANPPSNVLGKQITSELALASARIPKVIIGTVEDVDMLR